MWIKLFWFIVFVEVMTFMWNIYRYISFNRLYKKDKNLKNNHNIEIPQILITIPCLREQDAIKSTLEHLINITPNNVDLSIIVVTTEKEEFEKSKKIVEIPILANDLAKNVQLRALTSKYNELLPTSALIELMNECKSKNITEVIEIIKNKVEETPTTQQFIINLKKNNKKFKNVHLIHYPYREGIMADQLNFVLKELSKSDLKIKDTQKTYFAVYNADSIPNEKTIQEFVNTIKNTDFPDVLQQYSYCFSNWDSISNLMKGFSIFQSNFELRYGLINATLPKKFLYSYVVGHGMVFKLERLYELGGFETEFWCEDIYMSCLLRVKNIDIQPIFVLEKMETPQYLNILIRQNAVWFRTAFECIKMYKHVLRKTKKHSISGFFWMMQRLRMNLSWLLTPFLIIYTFLYSFFIESYTLFSFSLVGFSLMIIGVYFTSILLIQKLTSERVINKAFVLFFTGVAILISNLGPIYSLLNFKSNKKYKTVR